MAILILINIGRKAGNTQKSNGVVFGGLLTKIVLVASPFKNHSEKMGSRNQLFWSNEYRRICLGHVAEIGGNLKFNVLWFYGFMVKCLVLAFYIVFLYNWLSKQVRCNIDRRCTDPRPGAGRRLHSYHCLGWHICVPYIKYFLPSFNALNKLFM